MRMEPSGGSSQSAADAGMSKRGERRVCERVCVCV